MPYQGPTVVTHYRHPRIVPRVNWEVLLVMLEWGRQLYDLECPREGRTNISIEKEYRWDARRTSVFKFVVHLGGQPNAFEIKTMADFFFGKPEVVLYVGNALTGTPASSQYPRRNAAYRRRAKRYPRVYRYRVVSPLEHAISTLGLVHSRTERSVRQPSLPRLSDRLSPLLQGYQLWHRPLVHVSQASRDGLQ